MPLLDHMDASGMNSPRYVPEPKDRFNRCFRCRAEWQDSADEPSKPCPRCGATKHRFTSTTPGPKTTIVAKRLTGTGLKLVVTEKDTGQAVNYGVQLNNTTLEIESLPNLKVTVGGYQEMYWALQEARTEIERMIMVTGYAGKVSLQVLAQIDSVLAKAFERGYQQRGVEK